MKKRCKLGMCQLLTNLGSTMSKKMKIEEARAKLCEIVTRAHTIGIDSNRIMRLASAKKLYHPSSSRWLILLMLLPMLITLAWFGVSLYKDLKNKVHSPPTQVCLKNFLNQKIYNNGKKYLVYDAST